MYSKVSLNRAVLLMIAAFSGICFGSEYIPSAIFWPSYLLSYCIPVLLVVMPLAFFIYLFLDRWMAWLPLVIALFYIPHYQRTYGFSSSSGPDQDQPRFSILSYNVKYFRMPDTYARFSLEVIDWVSDDASDIKCIQEFSTNSNWEELDALKQIKMKGYDSFVYTADQPELDHNPGMAIFSRFDIVNEGIVWKDERNSNAAIFADLLVHDDTLRIYNVHFTSMGLHLMDTPKSSKVASLKAGSLMREKRIRQLIAHAKDCSYPAMIVGDFNQLPFGFNFRYISNHFRYTFKEVGQGLGLTLNHPFLPVRIDHQFHSEDILPVSLIVDQSMDISDHFPVIGTYALTK